MTTKLWLVLLLAAFMSGALANSQSGDGTSALMKLEVQFMQAAADHGSQGYLSYLADDAVELPNGHALLKGKAEIGKTMAFLDNPNNHLFWTPSSAGISACGDLGYTYGSYEFRSRDKDGKLGSVRGKYTTIWRKRKDGSWKAVLDMGNAGQ
jgi:ketosteroid isomerase-like protein